MIQNGESGWLAGRPPCGCGSGTTIYRPEANMTVSRMRRASGLIVLFEIHWQQIRSLIWDGLGRGAHSKVFLARFQSFVELFGLDWRLLIKQRLSWLCHTSHNSVTFIINKTNLTTVTLSTPYEHSKIRERERESERETTVAKIESTLRLLLAEYRDGWVIHE